MNFQRTMSAGDYVIDRGVDEMSQDEARQERVREYIEKRADELYVKRVANLSTVDFILALERISTLPREVCRLHYLTFADDSPFATELQAMVKAALLCDSVEIAASEASAMEEEPISRERH